MKVLAHLFFLLQLIAMPFSGAQTLSDAEVTVQDDGDRFTHSLEFPLTPGGFSWVEQSNDLQNWTPQAYWWDFPKTPHSPSKPKEKSWWLIITGLVAVMSIFFQLARLGFIGKSRRQ